MIGLTRFPASVNINLPSALADWPQSKELFRFVVQLNLIEFQVIKQPVRTKRPALSRRENKQRSRQLESDYTAK